MITLIVLPYSVRPDRQDEQDIEMTISEFVVSFFKMNWVIAALFFLTSNILMSLVIFLTNGFSMFGEYRYTTVIVYFNFTFYLQYDFSFAFGKMQLVNFAYALAFLGVFIKSAIELHDIVKLPDLTGENGLGIFPCFYMTVVSLD